MSNTPLERQVEKERKSRRHRKRGGKAVLLSLSQSHSRMTLTSYHCESFCSSRNDQINKTSFSAQELGTDVLWTATVRTLGEKKKREQAQRRNKESRMNLLQRQLPPLTKSDVARSTKAQIKMFLPMTDVGRVADSRSTGALGAFRVASPNFIYEAHGCRERGKFLRIGLRATTYRCFLSGLPNNSLFAVTIRNLLPFQIHSLNSRVRAST